MRLQPSNADERAMAPTERRDLILAVSAFVRGYSETWGRWPTVQEIEASLMGEGHHDSDLSPLSDRLRVDQ